MLTTLGKIRTNDAEWSEIGTILRRIGNLQADAMTASMIIGMISPWKVGIQDDPVGTPTEVIKTTIPSVKELSVKEIEKLNDDFRYPQLERAAQWVTDQKIITPEQLASLQESNRRKVFNVKGIGDRSMLTKFRNALSDSVKSGESLELFRARTRRIADVAEHEVETQYRTTIKRSYVDGLDQTLNHPSVADRFPYVYFSATRDTRVRDYHWSLDGFVVRKGTSEYRILKQILEEWNCRCSITPITESQAIRFGIKTMADIPNEVRDRVRF